jgi:hypothetical protein
MLSPGHVLRIDGDMGVLAAHADRIAAAGRGISDTGAAVHQAWQGLSAVYIHQGVGASPRQRRAPWTALKVCWSIVSCPVVGFLCGMVKIPVSPS